MSYVEGISLLYVEGVGVGVVPPKVVIPLLAEDSP
jgi:hypothetical protein